MDVFGTTVTAVHELWAVSVFIRGVVNDVRSYDEDRNEIRDRVAHEFLFLEQFKSFFIDGHGAAHDAYRNQSTAEMEDCNNIVGHMNKTLAVYSSKAVGYGLISSVEIDETPGSERNAAVRVMQRMASRMGEFKKKAIEWSIFDKAVLFKTLDSYREWTMKLRENASWIISSKLSQSGAFQDEQSQIRIKEMKLMDAFKRQALAATADPPASYASIDGSVKVIGTSTAIGNQPVMAKLATSMDDCDDAEIVVAEFREFELEPPEHHIAQQQALNRRLAWLLENSSFSVGPPEICPEDGVMLLSLNFRGYVEAENQKGVTFVYDPPKIPRQQDIPTITTLYDMINRTAPANGGKPSLGNRYFIAHALAKTVQNIHRSRWVHKNIWSKGVVLTSSPNARYPLRRELTVPYLAGWGIARPENARTNKLADHDVVANLYRHPFRQGQPTETFRSEHDIYALGVVLMEISGWRTIDKIFESDPARKRGKPNQRVQRWWSEEGRALSSAELGESFSEAIDWCLDAKKKIAEATRGGEHEASWMAFRKAVVDVIAKGMYL